LYDLVYYCFRFLEAEYKAGLTYPVGQLGPSKVTLKKTPEGWLTYNERTDTWSPLDENVDVTFKKPIRSDISQISSDGYFQRDTFSKASIQWLEYLMELARREGRPLQIQHALNGGEVPILGTNYKVDGKCGTTVYEFHGKFDLILNLFDEKL